MEASERMWINKHLCLSPLVYDSLQSFSDFKSYMHNVYIRAQKDPKQKWTTLPFFTIDDAISAVLETWPPEWCALDLVACYEMEIQRQKDVAKLLAQQK